MANILSQEFSSCASCTSEMQQAWTQEILQQVHKNRLTLSTYDFRTYMLHNCFFKNLQTFLLL